MKVVICFDELSPHFGPGQNVRMLAPALRRAGVEVAVVVEYPVPPDNQYLLALRHAAVSLSVPGRLVEAADRWAWSNELLLAVLLPLRLPLAIADVLIRRRSWRQAWRSVRGRLNRALPAVRLYRPWRWAARRALRRASRDADVIHLMAGTGAAVGWAARRHIPILYSENALPGQDVGVDWWTDLTPRISSVSMIVVPSRAGERAVRTYFDYGGPIAVVPNMFDDPLSTGALPPTAPTHGRALIIGCAARLTAAKGVDVLLHAARILCDRDGTRWELHIAGDGEERGALEVLADQLGLGDRVRFIGARGSAEMAAFWGAIDLFVLPTRWEAFGNVLVEAMANGKSVVASAVGGVPEVVVDGETGILVPAGEPATLAAAILALLEDDDLRLRLGRAGRCRYEQCFRSELLVERWLALYEQVRGMRPSGHLQASGTGR